MCKVIIDAGLYKKQFVQEQTDCRCWFAWTPGASCAAARSSRETARTSSSGGTRSPTRSLRRRATRWRPPGSIPSSRGVRGHAQGLRSVEVEPVFARLRRHLESYTPERAGEICEIHPENIRQLARKVASRKTKIFIGWNSGKYYHGDLMERAMALLLGLTGNWGKKGTGTRSWAVTGMDGQLMMPLKDGPGQEAAQRHIAGLIALRRLMAAQDPSQTREMLLNRILEAASETGAAGAPAPPAFLWYYQMGYKERWNDPENNCPSMKRSFDEYVTEAIERGWWGEKISKAYQTVEPRVLYESVATTSAATAVARNTCSSTSGPSSHWWSRSTTGSPPPVSSPTTSFRRRSTTRSSATPWPRSTI